MLHERKRAEDFSDRHEYLGASEVGQALGLIDTYGTAEDLWKEKTLRAPRQGHQAIFDRGHTMEPIIANWLRKEQCVLTHEQEEASTQERPWLVSHIDGIIVLPDDEDEIAGNPIPEFATGPGIIEMKAPGSRMTHKFNMEGVHEHYIAQMQVNLHNTGLPWGVFAYIDYDDWKLYLIFVQRDDLLLMGMLPHVDAFWQQVKDDKWETEPEPEPILKQAKKQATGSFTWTFGPEGEAVAEEYLDALRQVYVAEKNLEVVKQSIYDVLDLHDCEEGIVDARVRVKKVRSKGRLSYKGKVLYEWTQQLCEAIDGEEWNKVTQMVKVFMTEPDLFQSISKPSEYWKNTPSKWEE